MFTKLKVFVLRRNNLIFIWIVDIFSKLIKKIKIFTIYMANIDTKRKHDILNVGNTWCIDMENWREERTGAYTSPHFCLTEIMERRFFAQACACIKICEGQLSKYCCANNTTVGWAYMPNKTQQPLMSCWARLSISTRLTSPVNIQFSLSLRGM